MLSIFSSTYFQSVYLLWWNVQIFSSFFDWAVLIYIYLEDSFMDVGLILSLHSLSEEITNRRGSFISNTSGGASWVSPHHSAVTQRHLLFLAIGGPVTCTSACHLPTVDSRLVKNRSLLLLHYSVICREKLLLVNLNPSLVLLLSQIWCMKNLQNLPLPRHLPSCLLLLPAVTSQVQPMYSIFTPSYNESLEVLVYKTNEKRESIDAWDRGCCIDCFRTKKTCLQVSSKSVIGNFCKYPASKDRKHNERERKTLLNQQQCPLLVS